MSNQYLMALDAGGGAGRCFLISTDGEHSVSAYREWSYTQPAGTGPMGSIFDPDAFWNTLTDAIQEALDKGGIKGEQIVGVSSTSQREGCVFCDADGKEIYAGPNRDYRAVLEGMQLASEHGEAIYRRTGHFPSPLFAVARLLWHKNNAPDVYEKIAHTLMINDWVLYRLCGEYASEPSNASETCLYDLGTGEWMFDLIEDLGLNREIFPNILNSGTQVGVVSEAVASETGLVAGTPVVMGGADTQCGLLGCGAVSEGDIAAISGTTTPVQMVTNEPVIDPDIRLWAGAHVIPGLFVLESNAGYSGGVYQWFRDSFCEVEGAKAEVSGEDVYDLMNAEAALAPPGAGGVMSFIGVTFMDAKSMGVPKNVVYFGTTPLSDSSGSNKNLLVRAILESLAYAVRGNADQVANLSGRKIEQLRVCGGLANADVYLDILANVMGTPLIVPRIAEGSGLGAAICAGVGSGVYADFSQGVEALAKLRKEVQPDERLCRQYKTSYKRWCKTRIELEALSSSF
jgi:sugar (pentulose or hexulose) kinase